MTKKKKRKNMKMKRKNLKMRFKRIKTQAIKTLTIFDLKNFTIIYLLLKIITLITNQK